MSFRQIIVREANSLSFEHNCLVAKQEEIDVKIPLEDCAIIVIENTNSTITTNLINKCMSHNIILVICNEKHLPCGYITPITTHYRQLENVYYQLELNTVRKQNLWREIIKNKIQNQASVVELCDCDDDKVIELENLILDVERNDKTNREAHAAKIFFVTLYGSEFKRFINDKINNCLNYGYNVLAASIIRQLVSFGIDTKFGIWHRSKSNMFNLAYDLIEPFRPLVDYFIYSKYELIYEELTPRIRRGLISILNIDILVDDIKMSVQHGIENYVKDYMKFIRGELNMLPNIEILRTDFYEIE